MLWCINSYAISQEEIINQHLKDRKLDKIEGIWIHNGETISAIYKKDDSYVGIIIESSDMESGSNDLKLSKGSEIFYYGSAYTSVGAASIKIKMKQDFDSMTYTRNFKGQKYYGSANRIWPPNIRIYNADYRSEKDIMDGDKDVLDTINKAKKTCLAMGFINGTEDEWKEFSNCTLEIYKKLMN